MLKGHIVVLWQKPMPPSPICLILWLLRREMKRGEENAISRLRWRVCVGEGREGWDRGSSLSCSPLWDHVHSCLTQGKQKVKTINTTILKWAFNGHFSLYTHFLQDAKLSIRQSKMIVVCKSCPQPFTSYFFGLIYLCGCFSIKYSLFY